MKTIIASLVLMASFSTFADCNYFTNDRGNSYKICATKIDDNSFTNLSVGNEYPMRNSKYNANAVCQSLGYSKAARKSSLKVGDEGYFLDVKTDLVHSVYSAFGVRVLAAVECK